MVGIVENIEFCVEYVVASAVGKGVRLGELEVSTVASKTAPMFAYI